MRIRWIAVAATALIPLAARAADKPILAPAPAWVRPTPLPPVPIKSDQAAARLLLSDQQISFEPGKETVYSEVAFQIENSEGLAAGNLSLPWRPDNDVLTVHKLVIRRGDKTIDVLGAGQTFTVLRRETNLEAAMIDGVLTANIQPEGLQVGDILDFAFSITSSDPVVKGHVEAVAAAWNGMPVTHAHLAMRWPSTVPLRLRTTAALPAVKPAKAGNVLTAELSLENIVPVVTPKGAPPRFQLGRLLEATDYSSWADLAALMAPLYDHAATIPAQGPLRNELEAIRTASSDPQKRAEAALALVQQRTRYVALAMGAGGLVPADATTTWERRYGDCKGKTALLLALLHGLDIQAEPVVVSSSLGDGLDARLPMIGLFDHVLVRAMIGGHTYWLDGTRPGDGPLDRLSVPNFRWGLPLLSKGATLVPMVPAPFNQPHDETSIRIDAREGLTVPAPFVADETFRGDSATAMKAALASLAGDARDRALRDYWHERYDFVDVQSATADADASTGDMRFSIRGTAHMDWSTDWYETDGTAVGYKADFTRDPGPASDAPFAVAYPYFTKTSETIQLPPGFLGHKSELKDDVDTTVAGISYKRRASFADGTFTVEKNERSVAPEFPASQAPAAQATLRQLAEQTLYLHVPADYQPTAKEVAQTLGTTPTTAAGFLKRGNLLLDQDEFDRAIADFDQAYALDPKNAWALADPGIAKVYKHDDAGAQVDLNAAEALDPHNPVIFRARGVIASQKGDNKAAIAAYTRSLDFDPNNAFALERRAIAYRADGDNAAALKDTAAIIARRPNSIDTYLLRANIFRSQGDRNAALAEAANVSAANPTDEYAQVVAARIYDALQEKAKATAAYDKAIAIKPEAYVYINRSYSRSQTDIAGRRADIDQALKLDPKFADGLAAKADLQKDSGDFAGAVATYTTALAAKPDDAASIHVERGLLYERMGKHAAAEEDFAAAKAAATTGQEFNSMCWEKATTGLALQSALADCDAALAKQPGEPAYLDSRGLALLRLGRFDESIDVYSQAIAKRPGYSSSLYGRGVAYSRKGDAQKAAQDFAAATKADAGVAATYARFGINAQADGKTTAAH